MAEHAIRRLKLIGALLAVVLAGYAVGSLLDRARLPGVDLDASSVVEQLHADHTAPATGSPQAAVQVVVFTDYRCGVCRIDHAGVKQVAIARPDVRFVFKEWAALGPTSRLAAETALASAYQGRYQAARDALMRAPLFDGASVQRALATAGLDLIWLEADLRRHRREIDRELALASRQAFSLGLPGTPAYLVGRRLVVGRLERGKLERLIARAERELLKE
ncbi:thioredoxin domain-containing protein [Sphingomonas sp.]|jgi:protein-disulfide isomerase|uniref:thioredoxin domain-containing protein n=1 Tax=Sphingomonas sp. TaxID=28214 RepID=UPI002DF60665|nr:thioredoxin domain-containing protein [Sphingomonas sp.]